MNKTGSGDEMIHVVFSPSAAGILRQVLRARGNREQVVELTDWLDWGPIYRDGLQEREDWFNRSLPWPEGGWGAITSGASRFTTLVDRHKDRLIWVAPRSSNELCGLYWFLAKFGGDNVSMILADYPLRHARRGLPPLSLGELGIEAMGDLFDDAVREQWDRTKFRAERWSELCAEAALLRVIDQGECVSVVEDYFDENLIARCSGDWQSVLRVVGNTMVSLLDDGHCVDDTYLTWRLRRMAEQGRIESSGEITAYQGAHGDRLEVRLAQR